VPNIKRESLSTFQLVFIQVFAIITGFVTDQKATIYK